MTLYLKYRPKDFDEILSNRETVESLQAFSKKKDPPHAILLHGPTGCGKTTLARIFANKINCKGNDFREIDVADFRGIDTIRDIRKQSRFKPLESSCRVYLLDEGHKLSNDAQNALLKALEDTPEHVYYILCTTDPQKLISTIKGRCKQFQIDPLPEKEMLKLLRQVVKAEDEKLEKKVFEQIIQDSLCYPRNALQILEQVLNVESESRLEAAKRTAEVQSQIIELCRALINGVGWKKVSSILEGLKGQEPESIRRAILGYFSTILLKGENNTAASVMEEMIEPFYNTGFPGLVFACYSVICGKEDEPEDEPPF